MSGAKLACFLGLPTILSVVMLQTALFSAQWKASTILGTGFLSLHPTFFLHLFTPISFDRKETVFFTLFGFFFFSHWMETVSTQGSNVPVMFFHPSPLLLRLHNMHDWPVFSRWHATAAAHGFPTVGLFSSSRESRLSSIFGVSNGVKLAVWSVVFGVRWRMPSALGGLLHWSILS